MLGGVGGDEEQAELGEWVELQDPAVRAVLVDKHRVPAVASVKRVRRGTELAELWAEGDSRAWEAALDDLADRLSRRSKP